jgi:hypothetical protein
MAFVVLSRAFGLVTREHIATTIRPSSVERGVHGPDPTIVQQQAAFLFLVFSFFLTEFFIYFLIILQNYTINLKILQIWQPTVVRHGGRHKSRR